MSVLAVCRGRAGLTVLESGEQGVLGQGLHLPLGLDLEGWEGSCPGLEIT